MSSECSTARDDPKRSGSLLRPTIDSATTWDEFDRQSARRDRVGQGQQPALTAMLERLRAAIPALIGSGAVRGRPGGPARELRAVTWQDSSPTLTNTPPWRLALAVVLTAVNYGVLTGYDFLAFAYLGRHLPWRRVAMTSFLAYAISNNVGFAMLSGASVRYRFYTRWGITAEELSRIVFSYVVTFWLGLLLIGGLSLAVSPLPRELGLPAPALVAPLGWLLMLVSAGYVAAAVDATRARSDFAAWSSRFPRRAWPWRNWPSRFSTGRSRRRSCYVLLPPGSVPFLALVGAFLASQLLGLASHVPGGLGVFEGLMVLLLKPFIPSATLLPALIAYRAVYYLLPLSIAALALVADELHQRRSQAARFGATLGWLTEQLAPRVLAIFTFLSGVVLLASGATPAAAGRLSLLNRMLPLGLIELSHFAGSVVGAALLRLSQGLARRLDAAYVLTVLAMVVGIVASLLKGADYEEAIILAAILLVLWRARPAFDRRAALFDTRFSAGWIAGHRRGAAAPRSGSDSFAFKHVEYSNELWWQFELHGEASRMLRATVGARRHAAAVRVRAADWLRTARGITADRRRSRRRRGRHQHGRPRRSRISCSCATRRSSSTRRSRVRHVRRAGAHVGRAGRSGRAAGTTRSARPAVSGALRRLWRRAGLLRSLERAPASLRRRRIDIREARRGGECRPVGVHARGKPREEISKCGPSPGARSSATFRMSPPSEVPASMDQLRAVSDDWLAQHAGAEKGFSLGFFDEEYIARFPVAVIEQDGRIVAFANVWPGAQRMELSVDLMRYRHGAPKDVMDALFAHVMQWGKKQGYRWLTLGMAPLSGFADSPVAPLWNRLASFLYKHGEAIYSFQGLRAFKEKFDPVWQPHYLAYPGGLRLPLVLADVSALIAAGIGRSFSSKAPE